MSHHLHGPFNGNLHSLAQSRCHTELFISPHNTQQSVPVVKPKEDSCCGLFRSVRRAAHMETNETNRFTLSHLITETHLHPHQQRWEVRKPACLVHPPQLDSRSCYICMNQWVKHHWIQELDVPVWRAEDMSTHSMDCSEAAALRPERGTKLVVFDFKVTHWFCHWLKHVCHKRPL